MTKSEILEFIGKNPVFALATADENGPHVRMLLLYKADEAGLIFVTGENKDLNKQITKQPDVEMCFYSPKENKQIRVSGIVEELEDIELKKQVVKDFPFLKEWVDKEGYDVLVVYCLKRSKAMVWTMETNFRPKEYIQL
ncbi:MAG: pyridoxamine 5'-phosphate oxidase family protein [Sedimentisphaerales bacterium]